MRSNSVRRVSVCAVLVAVTGLVSGSVQAIDGHGIVRAATASLAMVPETLNPIGDPVITRVVPDVYRIDAGGEFVVTGQGFTPDAVVTFGGEVVDDVRFVGTTELHFRVPPSRTPGVRSLTVFAGGTVTQAEVAGVAKPVDELKNGEITTIAGGLPATGDGERALNVRLIGPSPVLVDRSGNLFFGDQTSERIRRLDAVTGIITSVVGGGQNRLDPGQGTTARILPRDLEFDRDGNILIADGASRTVRKFEIATGRILRIAGNGDFGITRDGRSALSAGLGELSGIGLDGKGNLYILSGSRIRRVDAESGIISTLLDRDFLANTGDLEVDGDGNIFVVDRRNWTVRRIDAVTRTLKTIAGNGQFPQGDLSSFDGKPATDVPLLPQYVTLDGNGGLLINGRGLVRVDLATGRLKVIDAGTFGSPRSRLFENSSISLDGTGRFLIGRSDGVFRFDLTSGAVERLAGAEMGSPGDGGPAQRAGFTYINRIAVDPAGNIFIGEGTYPNAVRRIDAATGTISTVIESRDSAFDVKDSATERAFALNSLAVDGNGGVFFSDSRNVTAYDTNTKRFRDLARDFDVVDKVLNVPFYIEDMTMDRDETLVVLVKIGGRNERRILRRIDPRTGAITRILGDVTPADATNDARFTVENARMTVDGDGNIYLLVRNRIEVLERGRDRFRPFLELTELPLPIPGLPSGSYPTLAADKNGNLYVTAILPQIPERPFFRGAVIRIEEGSKLLTVIQQDDRDGVLDGDGGPAFRANNAGYVVPAIDRKGNLLLGVTGQGFSALRLVKIEQ